MERFKVRGFERAPFALRKEEAEREIASRRRRLIQEGRAFRNRQEPEDFFE